MKKHLVVALVAAGLLGGCASATWGRAATVWATTVDAVATFGKAAVSTVEVLKGPVEDVTDIWAEASDAVGAGKEEAAPEGTFPVESGAGAADGSGL